MSNYLFLIKIQLLPKTGFGEVRRSKISANLC